MWILIIPICLVLFLEIKCFFRRNKNNFKRRFIRKILFTSYSVPSFVMVLLIVFLFKGTLITQWILPTLILSLSMLSNIAIIKRRNTLFNDNHVNRVLRKNNSKNISTFKHKDFPNFFSSSIFYIPTMVFSEIILIETVLSLPGLGYLFLEAMWGRDIFLIEAILFIFTLTIVSLSFLQSLLKLHFQIKNIKNTEINELLKEKVLNQ